MTPEQIIEMAKQTGLYDCIGPGLHKYAVNFAQLVCNAALEEAASTLEGHQFVQDGIAYRETQHAGSWQEKSTVGLFVTANTKKIRSLKS